MTPEIANFLAGSVEVQLRRCDKVLGPWFKGAGKFDVAWVDDPLLDPPRELTFEHLWNIEVAGLREGESVSLVNAADEPIMWAAAFRGAPVRLSALVPPAVGRELRVTLGSNVQGATLQDEGAPPHIHGLEMPHLGRGAVSTMRTRHRGDNRGVDIRQQFSLHAASIPLEGRCSRLVDRLRAAERASPPCCATRSSPSI